MIDHEFSFPAGSTSQTALIFIQDTDSTVGDGLTGVAFGDITWHYYREGAGTNATAITEVTMTIGTWASGGFIQLDITNQPGWYEIGIPDAVLGTGARFVNMTFKGATNMRQVNVLIHLPVLNEFDTPIALTDILSDSTAFLGASIAEILGDTIELQTDWLNGGRLDSILDNIKEDTTSLETTVGVAGIGLSDIRLPATGLDNILSSSTFAGAIADAVFIEDVGGSAFSVVIQSIQTNSSNILNDTDELQTDWLNGGRLDLILDNIKEDTTSLETTVGVAGIGLSDIRLPATGLDLVLVEGQTLPASMQIVAAVVAGKVSGAGTGTEVFKGIGIDATRVTVTVDSSGNRTDVTLA